jgi:hypothetical protein
MLHLSEGIFYAVTGGVGLAIVSGGLTEISIDNIGRKINFMAKR